MQRNFNQQNTHTHTQTYTIWTYNMIFRPKTGDVHFEFYSRKSDQKIVQDLLNHMIANGSLPGPGPVPLVKTALSFQQEPALWLNVSFRMI